MESKNNYQIVNFALMERLLDDMKTRACESTIKCNKSLMNQLRNFLSQYGGDYQQKAITPELCDEFEKYLSQRVRQSSCRNYLQRMSALLADAERRGIIESNPMQAISRSRLPKKAESDKVYLTKEELEQLRNAECLHENTRNAFLLSCYTGLSLTDIETLRWENITAVDGQWMIVKKLDKGGNEARVPMVEPTQQLMQKIKVEYDALPKELQDGRLFHLYTRTTIFRDLMRWAKRANLKKQLSFIVARHTFGTLAITAGIDLYTLIKWMGLSGLESARAYADMLSPQPKDNVEALRAILS